MISAMISLLFFFATPFISRQLSPLIDFALIASHYFHADYQTPLIGCFQPIRHADYLFFIDRDSHTIAIIFGH